MNPVTYNEQDLPLEDLQKIGLAEKGQVLLNANDLRALLSGGRTSSIKLSDLKGEGIHIENMNAKISLRQNTEGKLDLLIHPVYKKPATPDFLDETDAEKLEKGEVANLLKKVNGRELLIEYDADTREFIVSDSELILAPDMVNGEHLNEDQKLRYRKGKEVQIADGTVISHTAVDPHGVRSNRLAIVASILIDGGVSYMVFKGLNALFNKKQDADASKQSDGYKKAMNDLESHKLQFKHNYDQQQTRKR